MAGDISYLVIPGIIKTELNYESSTPYIRGKVTTYTPEYFQYRYFETDSDGLTASRPNNPTKLAFVLNNTNEDNTKMLMIDNLIESAASWNASGYAYNVTSLPGTYTYQGDWYSSTNIFCRIRDGESVSDTRITTWEMETNIPIFEFEADAYAYTHGDEAKIYSALNYIAPVVPSGEDFEISNPWTHGTWTAYGHTEGGSSGYRNVRGRITSGKLSLYNIPYNEGDPVLKYGVASNAEFFGLEYSTDGITWIPSETFPFEFFYKPRTNELGEFDYGLTFYGLPVFADEVTADGYNEGSVPITDAENWNQISHLYPGIDNPTGDEVEQTVFGEVFTKGFFSQQYILDETAIQEIANGLFDTQNQGMWESIKKGLEMYGDDPINAVMGLSFWPVNLASVFNNVQPQTYIYFGGYKFDLSSGSCNKIVHPNGYKTIATTYIFRRLNNWMDFEPYTKLYIMLPYCGTYQLDLARYYGKSLEVRYYLDTRTNSIICCLISGGQLIDYFNGQMGCTMPITLTDYSGFANAQISTLLGGGGQAVQTFGNAAAQTGAVASSLGAAGSVLGGVALAGAVTGAKTVYGLSQNNINNFNKTKGGSTSMINQFLPQRVTLIWEYQESCEPSNYYDMVGSPSMRSGYIGGFSGFLKCQSVKLKCATATESERERLKQMLLSGVYI